MAIALTMTSCKSNNTRAGDSNAQQSTAISELPTFSADSAYAFCQRQCDFGPRTMNSEAHEQCGQWIAQKFASYGLDVTEQRVTLRGFDGTPLLANNIIASYRPELKDRILVCAHWDSRPWADNDPDEANHTKPVMAANDGASGVAVMLELARLLKAHLSSTEGDTIDSPLNSKTIEAPSGAVGGASPSGAVGGASLLQRIRQLMEQEQLYLNSELTIADLADRLGLHRNQLSDCINRQTGATFLQLVANYRVEHAKQLLRQQPDMKVSVVGSESGFANEKSFFRTFKAATGMTPSEWRAQQGG